jgi:hypothetical protein
MTTPSLADKIGEILGAGAQPEERFLAQKLLAEEAATAAEEALRFATSALNTARNANRERQSVVEAHFNSAVDSGEYGFDELLEAWRVVTGTEQDAFTSIERTANYLAGLTTEAEEKRVVVDDGNSITLGSVKGYPVFRTARVGSHIPAPSIDGGESKMRYRMTSEDSSECTQVDYDKGGFVISSSRVFISDPDAMVAKIYDVLDRRGELQMPELVLLSESVARGIMKPDDLKRYDLPTKTEVIKRIALRKYRNELDEKRAASASRTPLKTLELVMSTDEAVLFLAKHLTISCTEEVYPILGNLVGLDKLIGQLKDLQKFSPNTPWEKLLSAAIPE